MEANFGGKLVSKSGIVDTAPALAEADLVGIYFSAHWCPPCRGFTPKLAEFYNKVKESNKKLEIVFVSHDRDEGSFNDYYSEMPWLAIPFDNDTKEKLIQAHKVSGIPKLVFLSKDGSVKTKDGRAKVMEEGSVESFPWN